MQAPEAAAPESLRQGGYSPMTARSLAETNANFCLFSLD